MSFQKFIMKVGRLCLENVPPTYQTLPKIFPSVKNIMETPVVPFYRIDGPTLTKEDRKGRHDSKLSNPLEPCMSEIRLCGFLGFPLKLTGRYLKPFGLTCFMRYFPLFSYNLIFYLLQSIFFAIVALGGVESSLLENLFQLLGFNAVDLLAMAGIFIPHSVVLFKQYFNLLDLTPQWNRLNAFFGKILSQDDVNSCFKQFRTTRTLVSLLYGVMMIFVMGMTYTLLFGVLSLSWLIPGIIALCLSTFLSYYPLSLFLTFVLINHYILLFKKAINLYNQRIQTAFTTLEPTNLTTLLNDGVEIVDALSLLDAIFGGAITLEVALCLMTETFGSYFGSTLYGSLINNELPVFIFKLVFIAFGIKGFVRYFTLSRNGQALTNAMKDCQTSLNKLDIQASPLTPVQEKQMAFILSRFSQPVAWSPMGLFDLSQTSLVLIHSVIVTYLVVLIQFNESAREIDVPNDIAAI